MKYIDLTHTFESNMPVYPGDALPEVIQTSFLSRDGYNDFMVKTGMHVGTHIDAPLHMVEGGKRISELSLEKFFGKGYLIDVSKLVENGAKTIDESFIPDNLEKGSVLIIYTGYSAKFRDRAYYETFPEITEGFARKALKLGVSIVGMDTPSPDRPPFTVHKILLGAEVLIIENLANVSALKNKEFSVIALPAKYDTEAAPVRVVACVL